MRRLHLGVLASVVPALLASLVLVGCGSNQEKGTGDTSKPTDAGKRGSGSSGTMKAVEPGTGTLKGKVTLQGAKPDMKAATQELLALINKADDKATCLMSPEDQRTEQEWRIGDNNGVGNVFVWIAPLPNEFFKIDEKQLAAVPKEVPIEQPFCAFVPHCFILFPQYRDPKSPKSKFKETGQKFVVKNDAKISHNTKFQAGAKNPEFNETLKPMSHKDVPLLEPTNEEITVRCGIHLWMSAYGRAFDHPYATLTVVGGDPKAGKVDPKDPKYGTYELKNLPAGKVRVIAWHPKAGYLNGAKGEEIELKAGDNPPKDFSITAK